MNWLRLALFGALAAALPIAFRFCRKKGEHAAGLNLAIIQLIFGGWPSRVASLSRGSAKG